MVRFSHRLHSVPQYEVRRYTHPEGKLVSDWYYAEELTLRPAENAADPEAVVVEDDD